MRAAVLGLGLGLATGALSAQEPPVPPDTLALPAQVDSLARRSDTGDSLGGLLGQADTGLVLADTSSLERQLAPISDTLSVPENPYGVEADADGDGVPVYADWCPDTRPGAAIDERGCATSRIPWWGWLVGLIAGVGGISAIVRGIRGSLARRRRARIARYGREVDHELGAVAETLGLDDRAPWLAEAPTDGLLDPGSDSQGGGAAPGMVMPRPDPAAPPEPLADVPGYPTAAPPPFTGGDVGFPLERDPDPVDLDFEGTRVPADFVPSRETMARMAAEEAEGKHRPEDWPGPMPAELASPSSAVPAGITKWKQSPLRYDEESTDKGKPTRLIAGLAVALVVASLAVAVRGGDPNGDFAPVEPLPRQTDQPVVVAFSDDPVDPSAPPGTVPARMLLMSGDGQQAMAGARLAEPIAVRVEDVDGVPVPGVRVFFEATLGGGRVSPLLVATDSVGVAQASWRLGTAADRQYVIARVEGYEDGAGVAFEALAVAGEVAALRLLAGASQTGTANLQLDSAIVVRVEDSQGNPVPGVTVEFVVDAGEGTVSPDAAESDSTGAVRTYWTLGEGTPTPVLTARVREAPDMAVEASATLVYPRLDVRTGVVTGGTHTCQLVSSGGVRCWGSNQAGQLGTGDGQPSRIPRAVPSTQTFSAIAAGLAHTCGLTQEGVAMCWGDNASGQLGTGDTGGRLVPTSVATDVRFRSIAAGPSHTCAVSRGGQGYCWGSNTSGQLGDGTRTDRAEPVRIALSRGLQEVSAGWTHTCALALDGTAYCWGRNAFGQLGNGSTADQAAPTAIGGSRRFRRLAAGSAHTCAVQADGQLACWGQNNYGQLGLGDLEARAEPTTVAGGPWRAVATGGVHTCALTTEGGVACWGRNTYGQLGDGSQQDHPEPAAALGDVTFRSLQASGAHTCGTDTSGRTHCWGFNIEGQIGDGTRENRAVPVQVGSL